MGNRDFADKKKELEKSSIIYRNDIINEDTWTEVEIIRHREKMIADFLEAFPVPNEMKESNNYPENDTTDNLITPFLADDLTNTKPKIILINGEERSVNHWKDVLLYVMRKIFLENETNIKTWNENYSDETDKIFTTEEVKNYIDEHSPDKQNISFHKLHDGKKYKYGQKRNDANEYYIFTNKDSNAINETIKKIIIAFNEDQEEFLLVDYRHTTPK
jgi:hypothetical protein